MDRLPFKIIELNAMGLNVRVLSRSTNCDQLSTHFNHSLAGS